MGLGRWAEAQGRSDQENIPAKGALSQDGSPSLASSPQQQHGWSWRVLCSVASGPRVCKAQLQGDADSAQNEGQVGVCAKT